jgi:hypothetical protein
MARKKAVKQAALAREHSRMVMEGAPANDQRTGQYLFNTLPQEVRATLTGRPFDPFYKEMSQYQVEEWLGDHIMFDDDGEVIALYSANMILWQKKGL